MKKKWTILLIPAASGEVRDISLSVRRVTVVMASVTALLLVSAVFCAKKIHSIRRNDSETIGQLQQQMAQREQELGSIKSEFSKLLELEGKLRATAGLKPRQSTDASATGKGGQGGPGPDEQLPSETDQFVTTESSSESSDMSSEDFLAALRATQSSFTVMLDTFDREQRRLACLPSINPVSSRKRWISSGFGYRLDPIDGKRRFHDGLDLAAAPRTPIVAPADGMVTYSGWHGGLGKTIEISHGYGYRTIYGHNSKLVKKTGQRVKRGDVIAYLGSTGRSTGPHLHYEVHFKGKCVNPYKYLID